jgi:hypothetical protein
MALLMRVYIWPDLSLLVRPFFPDFPGGSEREQRGLLVAWRLVEPKRNDLAHTGVEGSGDSPVIDAITRIISQYISQPKIEAEL